MVVRRGCDNAQCHAWPVWKVRQHGDRLERNWIYACGRHLNTAASECATDAGVGLDVVRVLADE